MDNNKNSISGEEITRKNAHNTVPDEVYRLYDSVIDNMRDSLIKAGARGHTLVITDPYLLSSGPIAVAVDLTELLLEISPSKVISICKHGEKHAGTEQLICEDLRGAGIDFYAVTDRDDLFHDRFWFVPCLGTGIVIGASFNGISSGRMFYMNDLTSGEVGGIYRYLGDHGMLCLPPFNPLCANESCRTKVFVP